MSDLDMKSNGPNNKTALERAILKLYYERLGDKGFPSPEEFTVSKRENTGSGRYTYFSCPSAVDLPNGRLDVGTYGQINMEGVRSGASFTLYVDKHMVTQLEISVNGTDIWDGTEREWKICDPDTGVF